MSRKAKYNQGTSLVSRVDVKGLISLPRVHIAVNCGPEVKLIRICPQIDSAVVLGMGHALSAKWSQPTI